MEWNNHSDEQLGDITITKEDGAEVWEVYSNGQEVLRAVFINNKFHVIKKWNE